MKKNHKLFFTDILSLPKAGFYKKNHRPKKDRQSKQVRLKRCSEAGTDSIWICIFNLGYIFFISPGIFFFFVETKNWRPWYEIPQDQAERNWARQTWRYTINKLGKCPSDLAYILLGRTCLVLPILRNWNLFLFNIVNISWKSTVVHIIVHK